MRSFKRLFCSFSRLHTGQRPLYPSGYALAPSGERFGGTGAPSGAMFGSSYCTGRGICGPDGAPISDDDNGDCDYFVEIPHSELEGDLFEDVAPAVP